MSRSQPSSECDHTSVVQPARTCGLTRWTSWIVYDVPLILPKCVHALHVIVPEPAPAPKVAARPPSCWLSTTLASGVLVLTRSDDPRRTTNAESICARGTPTRQESQVSG